MHVVADNLTEFLRELPMFAAYGDGDLAALADSAEMEPFRAGELIFEQGQVADRFYIVYEGRVRTLLRRDGQDEINLGVLKRGDHFGETALIANDVRSVSARAVEDSVLLAISRETFHDYLLTTADQRDYFERSVQVTSIQRFLKSRTDLSRAPARELREMAMHLQPEFHESGSTVMRQGEEADKFYLVERGALELVRRRDGREDVISVLHEGEFFGEQALLGRSACWADVVCATDCYVFSLSREGLDSLLAASPGVRAVIEDRSRSHSVDEPPIAGRQRGGQELLTRSESAVAAKRPAAEATDAEEDKHLGTLKAFYRRRIRFPFIMQPDQMACGTTCIMMVARYYGKSFSSSRVRELAHVDRSGASLADLASAAEHLGFSTRAAKLDYDTLRAAAHPCLVHWQGYHFVVVSRMTSRHVWVADPARGMRRCSRAYFCENWTGVTLLLEPTPQFAQQREDRSSLGNFLQFIAPHKRVLVEVFLASLLLNLFGLASPIFTQNVIDKVLAHNDPSVLNLMLLGMLLVLGFRMLVGLIRQYLIVHTSLKIDLRMLTAFYKHLLALRLGYFKVRKLGDFMARFGENRKIRTFLANTALTLVLDALLIIVYVSLMCYYNLAMTALAMLLVPLLAVLTFLFTPVLKRLNVDSFAAHADSASHLIESVNGIDTVKALNLEHRTRWKWESKFVKCLNVDFKLSRAAFCFHSLGEMLAALGSTLILWYGAHQVMRGELSVGELMAFVVLMGSVIAPVTRIIGAWDDIQQTLVAVERLDDVFTAEPELDESADEAKGLVLRQPKGEVAFQNVFFRYGGSDDPYVLSSVEFKVEPGQTLAVVGRSGSGKSTLVRLIARLYEATEGRITIDGIDVRNIHLPNLRRIVGYVLQESFLFDGTVRENIVLGDPEETTEKVVRAARLANAHDFISGLPQGYQTRVGESGLQLSGGQKQRIAIARALYADPKIVVLDEATNALDAESEQAIQENMESILAGKTAIVIAHRLSTVRNADRIVVLDKGEIVEQGTHGELMDLRGLYHHLAHQQLAL